MVSVDYRKIEVEPKMIVHHTEVDDPIIGQNSGIVRDSVEREEENFVLFVLGISGIGSEDRSSKEADLSNEKVVFVYVVSVVWSIQADRIVFTS